MELLSDPNIWIVFGMLTALEIVLGINNIIFISILALAFLVMVGVALTAEAFDQEVPKGYIYAAMAFSLAVEALNIRSRAKRRALATSATPGT